MTARRAGPATLIVSPLASRIREEATRRRVTSRAVEALRARGHDAVEVVESGDPAAIRAAAGAAVERGASLVAVAGGDGTVRDASGALAETGVDVAIVPCGTGNLFSTAIGVPRDLDAALVTLRDGTSRPFDVGQVRLLAPPGTTPDAAPPDAPIDFGVACGTGFDAQLIASTSREMKRRYGVAAYFLAASRLLPHLAPQPTTLVVDGERMELESVVVLVANCGEAIPGLLRPRLPIAPDDGLFHVFVLPRGGVLGGVRGALELMLAESRGISPSGHAARFAGREVRVEVTPAGPTQIDGDPFPAAWLDARLRPGGLRVVTP